MTALGHSRHFAGLPMTSGLPPEADIVKAGRHVSNVPIGDVALMLDEKEAANRGGLTLSASELDVAVSLFG
jgi:hypothetical protein